MKVRTITKDELLGTSRHVKNDVYDTVRFLLEADGLGVTVTDNTLAPGREEIYGYDHHVEIAYCLEGDAELEEIGTGRVLKIMPGTMWVAEKGSRFRFLAHAPTRVICVFTPPFSGQETGFAGDQ
jgi:L-ectoine synthase